MRLVRRVPAHRKLSLQQSMPAFGSNNMLAIKPCPRIRWFGFEQVRLVLSCQRTHLKVVKCNICIHSPAYNTKTSVHSGQTVHVNGTRVACTHLQPTMLPQIPQLSVRFFDRHCNSLYENVVQHGSVRGEGIHIILVPKSLFFAAYTKIPPRKLSHSSFQASWPNLHALLFIIVFTVKQQCLSIGRAPQRHPL